MGIFNKFTSKIGLSDSEEERRLKEELAEEESDEAEEEAEDEEEEAERVPNFEQPSGHDFGRNVVDFTSAVSARDSGAAGAKLKVIVIEPRSFDDAQQVANSLREKRPVVVNFENTDGESARRIIDFISGTTYALNGEIRKVGRNVFFCAPSNVNVTIEEERRGSSDLPWLKK